MDIAEVIQLIFQMGGGVAFPIVMCVMLFNYIKSEQSQTREVLESLRTTIRELTIKIGGDTKDDLR